jgi:hypothetical protein
MKIEVDVPDALWERMRACRGVDWSEVASRAFRDRVAEANARAADARSSPSYRLGYAWARDHADADALRAVAEAASYRCAADIVRRSPSFSERDEFGDALKPSDEMWEAFVDGATAQYNDR